MKEKNEKAIFLSILCVSFLGVQMIKSYEYGILDFFSYVFFQHPNGRYVFWTIMGKLNVLLICKILILQTSKNFHILAVSDEDGYVSLFDSRRRHPYFASYQENAGLFSLSNYILGFWLLLVHFYQSSLSFWWKLIILCAEKARLYEWVAHDNAVFDVCWIKVCTCHKDLLKICDVFWFAHTIKSELLNFPNIKFSQFRINFLAEDNFTQHLTTKWVAIEAFLGVLVCSNSV